MATVKKKKGSGMPKDLDRFTSASGLGITVAPQTPEQLKKVEELNRELDAAKKKAAPRKKKTK